MNRIPKVPVFAASLLSLVSFSNAQSFYVDVTNETPNPQFHLPTGYAHFPSYDFAGPGFSAGSSPLSEPGYGTYYIADGFLSGHTTNGLWQSWWLDALHPDEDIPPHGGLGTVDILAPGGVPGGVGDTRVIGGYGMPAAPLSSGDTNREYLGIGADATNSEYAVWETAFVVSATTTFQYQYSWIAAGFTLDDGTEILPVGAIGMGAHFFVDTDTDYSNGELAFSAASELQTYNGGGEQEWFTETGTFTLEPGTYYWGFSATGDGPNIYIGVEGISISPVPEPSAALLGLAGAGMLTLRRRRAATA